MANYLITEILKTRKITEYLESKGHMPVGNETNGKIKYRCPLHAGDNTPSFMVYLNAEHENFFCYGCRSGYSIIHLYRDLEKVSLREAIKALGNGLNINIDSEIEFIIKEIENDASIKNQFSFADFDLIISRMIYSFLKLVNNDPQESERADKMLAAVDKAIERCEIDELNLVYHHLPDALKKRAAIWNEKNAK